MIGTCHGMQLLLVEMGSLELFPQADLKSSQVAKVTGLSLQAWMNIKIS
jgi:hypothetical protein